MIEFLPPRDGAFGSGDGADFVGFDGDDDAAWGEEPPRSRWLTALAVLGVTGMLAGGVIAASPWSGEETAPAPTTAPSTSVPVTTEPGVTTTTDLLDTELPAWADDSIPGWVLPDGDRFQLTGANSYDSGQFGFGDPYDLWTTDDATRTSGTWLYVASLQQQGDFLSLRRDADVVDLGGNVGLIATSDDGVTEVVVERPGQISFQVVAHGFDLARLLAVVGEIEMSRNGPGYGDLVSVDGLLDGMTRRVSQQANSGYGPLGLTPSAVTSYYDTSRGEWLELSMSPRDDERLLTAELLFSRVVDETTLTADDLERLAQLRRLGLEAQVREPVPTSPWPYPAVVWPSVDGTFVTVTGHASVSTLLEAAVQAVRAAPRQWQRYVRETLNGVQIDQDVESLRPTELGGDVQAQWQAVVQDDIFSVYGPNGYVYEPFDVRSGPEVRVYRSLDDAYVLATNSWPNDGMQILVDQPGAEADPSTTNPTDTNPTSTDPTGTPTSIASVAPEPARLVQVGDRPFFGVVIRIDPLRPFTVRWFDLDGNPVDGPER